MRKIQFQNDYYYHIYNRGVDKRKVFMDEKDYFNFLIRLRDFNNDSTFEKRKELNSLSVKELSSFLAVLPKFVKIITYCLNPNHYHLLLKQVSNQGIEKFMHKISTGYTNYFNLKYGRNGSLFQGRYKAVHVKTDDRLLYLSCYINGNPEIHKISKAEKWPWSSYKDFLELRNGTLCNKKVITDQFKNAREYKNLVDIIIKESKQKKNDIKKYLLE